ncbi:hypothetical protein B9N43_15250 [Denitratisoma sp. DHT3]|uniref:c-type cytochrome n=1 Tax=Denitratisoma sp. DHT3 TaxID=1981880 RepID=UPI00119879A6|nr:c-type cytochrome [Denitratisoma sp. DHT3]QDX83017.1 hypothetical protein B9N43_15250 [Denitratisoma sp. DHT3]
MSHFNPRIAALLSVLSVSSAAIAMGGKPKVDEEAVLARIQPVAQVQLAGAAGSAAGGRSGEDLFQSACNACHGTGALNAPKVGDKGAWAPRLAKGLDGLLKSATNGLNAMPPKGGAADATDKELASAIVYMVNKSGGNLKEPQ